MDYLKSTTLEVLEELYKNEKDADVKLRILMCIHKKEKRSDRDVANIVRMPKTVVNRWVNRFSKHGISGLQRKEGSGGHNKYLTGKEEKQLQNDLKESPMTAKEVLVHIKEKFGKKYHPNSISRLMHRLGQSLITPRPRHHKANPRSGWAFKGHIKKNSRNG